VVILVTGVTGGSMVVYGDVIDECGDLCDSVNGGTMVVSGFVIASVALLVMGVVRSLYCHIGDAWKSMRPTK
jgi:hypothetical protein